MIGMNVQLTNQQARILRMKAQRLMPEEEAGMCTPAEILRACGGMQAQELPAALLGLRARSRGLTAEQVNQVRNRRPEEIPEAGIAWAWCMRGTLHLILAADAGWMTAFYGEAMVRGNRRRFVALGWDDALYERGKALIQGILARRGSLTRPEIKALLAEAHLPYEGQAVVHFLFRAVFEGIVCLGSDIDHEPAYCLAEQWLGKRPFLERDEGLRRLGRRFLAAFGPAGPNDLAFWAGIRIGAAREAWNLIAEEMTTVDVEGRPVWLAKDRLPWLERIDENIRTVRLLPRYDTLWMGYASRDLLVDDRYLKRVQPGGGQINAMLLVDGQVAGTWKTRKKGRTLVVDIDPLFPLPGWTKEMIEAEAVDIGRFLGCAAQLGTID
jgi:hypothetical protein